MHPRITLALAALFASTISATAQAPSAAVYARDPAQPVDEAYGAKIREYTTDPQFNTPLTDYLPAAPGVPTPVYYITGTIHSVETGELTLEVTKEPAAGKGC